ncbi:unnamed protein product [Closterium sp. NIES-64]|nr:unnamed protein product [Closterium sp. NIES-64]
MGPATAQGARPSGGTAQMADDMHVAAVVGQARGEPVAVQHVQPSTSTPTARPTGVTAQLPDDLLRPAAVVGQQGGPPDAGQHLHPSTSTPTAQDARPAGVTALVDELLRPAAVVGQQGGPPGTGQHTPTATSPATAQDARPAGATALVDELLRPTSVVGQHVQQAAAASIPTPRRGKKTPVFLRLTATRWRQGAEDSERRTPASDAGSRGSTVEAAVWRAVEGAGGVDERILASIVMPDPEIEVMREKIQAAAPTVGAQQGCTSRIDWLLRRTIARLAPNPLRPQPASALTLQRAGRLGDEVWEEEPLHLPVDGQVRGAYCIAVAVSSFDGFVSDVVLDEFGGVKEEVMAQYKADWNVARLIPGGMWMVMWSRGRERLPRQVSLANAQLVLVIRRYARGPVGDDQCHGGSSGRRRGGGSDHARSVQRVRESVSDRHRGGASAGGLPGVVVGEVAETVTKDLQAAVVRSRLRSEKEREHDELIARVMIENLAFWGDCNVGTPKLKARGVDLPIDPQMKIIIRDRGARGQQHKGKQVADA